MEVLILHTDGMAEGIKIYDGSNRSTTLVGTIGGHDLPGDIFSDSSLFIDYQDYNYMTEKEWFKIKYTISEYKQGIE